MTYKGRIHIVIGDTQVKPGVPTAHLSWIGQYIVDQFAGQDAAIVHVGDHWDMPSLSSYDKGKKEMEGRRYVDDIRAGNKAFDLLKPQPTGVGSWCVIRSKRAITMPCSCLWTFFAANTLENH